MSETAHQRYNTANEKQVKDGKNKERVARDRELNDLRVVLSTPQGRRFLNRVMKKCHVFESIWEQSARIHYNAGQQDIGQWLFGEINNADAEAFFKIVEEERKEGV